MLHANRIKSIYGSQYLKAALLGRVGGYQPDEDMCDALASFEGCFIRIRHFFSIAAGNLYKEDW
jgi:hypothetical protein